MKPRFEQALAKYLTALESGQTVEPSEILSQYPEFAAELASFLRMDQQLVDALSSSDESPSNDSDSLDASRSQSVGASFLPLRESRPSPHNERTLLATTLPEKKENASWSFARLDQAAFPVSFGSYSLLSEIDRGGMGVVFKARHETLNRTVALKVLRSGEMASAEELRRFRAEAEATAALNHPNIVPIFEVGEVNGLVFFTMVYVDGQDLSALIRAKPISPRDAAKIIAKVADAIATAHRAGIIHRDLKPSNILLDSQSEPFLIDFGLAKFNKDREDITHTGQILGTPAYMPPEQASGRVGKMSVAVDIYSLGAVLYALVTRQPPFSGPSPFDILLQVLDREPPSPSKLNKQVPRALEAIIARAMEKQPQDRYASAQEFSADLQRFLVGEPIDRPKPTLAERFGAWWRREPILICHLIGIGIVFAIVCAAIIARDYDSTHMKIKLGLLAIWGISGFGFQRVLVVDKWKEFGHLGWATFDVAIYSLIIYLADPPRGLLMVGYPMMIAASGLFYRVRWVSFMTILCVTGFVGIWTVVDDPFTVRPDFCVIYISGLLVQGLSIAAMIRRVRGLSDYYEEAH